MNRFTCICYSFNVSGPIPCLIPVLLVARMQMRIAVEPISNKLYFTDNWNKAIHVINLNNGIKKLLIKCIDYPVSLALDKTAR